MNHREVRRAAGSGRRSQRFPPRGTGSGTNCCLALAHRRILTGVAAGICEAIQEMLRFSTRMQP
jgi:hypothetical protein